MVSPADVAIRSRQRVYDGFFKIDELVISHRLTSGGMSADRPWLVFERGDAVAVLLFNRDRQRVILVEQFRAPTVDKGSGWVLETVAGMIRDGEGAVETVIRETFEETGFRITAPEHVATFFSSPGGSSERIFLYFAEVSEADRCGPGGGKAEEGEDIRLVELRPDELFEKLRPTVGRIGLEDPKLIIAAQDLRERLRDPGRAMKPGPLASGTINYRTPDDRFTVGIKTGEILKVKGVDIWVNSENTDMMMDRIIGKTISANIRYGGAEKDAAGRVLEDTIADALRRELGGNVSVSIGSVIGTVPGMLAETNGVMHILHVASVMGEGPGKGIRRADEKSIGECVRKVLEKADRKVAGLTRWNRLRAGIRGLLPAGFGGAPSPLLEDRYRSILIPMLGAGDGQLDVEDVAKPIVEASLDFFAENPETNLRSVYLLAYTSSDKTACERVLEAKGFKLEPQ